MRRLTLAFCLLAGACASVHSELPSVERAALDDERLTVQRAAVEEALARDERVRRLAWPLLTANTELCEKTAPRIGVRLGDVDVVASAARGLRKSQVEALGFSDEPFILSVAPGSPAAEAGLTPLTKVLRIGNAEEDIATAADFGAQYADALKRYEDDEEDGILFTVEQDGAERQLAVVPALACDIEVVSSGANEINARATFKTITIYAGLVRALEENDDALAFVIGHEIAHVAGRHPHKGLRNAAVTGALAWAPPLIVASTAADFVAYPLARRFGAKAPPFSTLATKGIARTVGSTDFEREADYLGLYMLARAGRPTDRVPEVFQLFANVSPRSSWLQVTHPVVPERTLRLRLAAEEIAAKRAAGQELVPEGWEE
ncbi:M48 family metalloprotease [Parvularcula maris]|uniref:M48 family metalloprotease n=1 Tax=Parvularcula maris TaxID=2965077 RepID=A0A9X2LBQ6_9PROT|nr:M48 family metalloprotease [Parvularcula maris]MCQ8186611.1 M48 family metalloprotease [Parvularcula maris]